jgi:lipid-A-disaccharide synthase-like uncharacterized protein
MDLVANAVWRPHLARTLLSMNLHTEIMVIGTVAITGWKIIGWSGALCFALRWGVQVWHRKKTAENRLPSSFWWISIAGAGMTLAYFIFGQPDSVGVVQNVLPLGLAAWNLAMDYRERHSA